MPESRSLPASLHSLQTFGAISRFLREGVADEDSREMREGVGALAQVIDETVKVRRAGGAGLQALEPRSSREGGAFERLELLAWRTLGEGMLLIDMYEQGSGGMLSAVPESAPPPARSPWARLAAWYRRLRG